jgi:hypothetical protein
MDAQLIELALVYVCPKTRVRESSRKGTPVNKVPLRPGRRGLGPSIPYSDHGRAPLPSDLAAIWRVLIEGGHAPGWRDRAGHPAGRACFSPAS